MSETGSGSMTATSQRAGIMSGKRGLVMGVANERSIAWGIASALAHHGAEVAFSYQAESFRKRLEPLAQSIGSSMLVQCDVGDQDSLDQTFATLRQSWDTLDFVVHAIAYSDKNELKGRYADTSRENFRNTMDISCYSFTAVTRAAMDSMGQGGSLLTLTYLGAERTVPNYNVMGVAKAALEASVRYLANDLGGAGIRVNALSAGPMKTLAGSAIADARYVYRYAEQGAPLGHNPSLEQVGNAALYLLSNLSSGVTGEVHHVDGGFHVMAIPHPKTDD
jgi:enoyl-[acyl-carrier protein] reductase I